MVTQRLAITDNAAEERYGRPNYGRAFVRHGLRYVPLGNSKFYRIEQAKSVIRTGPKVGRNEPCPCGSGLKSKRCCGR